MSKAATWTVQRSYYVAIVLFSETEKPKEIKLEKGTMRAECNRVKFSHLVKKTSLGIDLCKVVQKVCNFSFCFALILTFET